MKNQGVFAFLGGAIIGAAVAILFAPDKGTETRKKIKNMVKEEQDKLLSALKCNCSDPNCDCENGNCDCDECDCENADNSK